MRTLQKKLNFRFITTTHWVFKTGPVLNRVTNWGEYAIAVSDDIKQYLIDNYDMPEGRISVTVNGSIWKSFHRRFAVMRFLTSFLLTKR